VAHSLHCDDAVQAQQNGIWRHHPGQASSMTGVAITIERPSDKASLDVIDHGLDA